MYLLITLFIAFNRSVINPINKNPLPLSRGVTGNAFELKGSPNFKYNGIHSVLQSSSNKKHPLCIALEHYNNTIGYSITLNNLPHSVHHTEQHPQESREEQILSEQ